MNVRTGRRAPAVTTGRTGVVPILWVGLAASLLTMLAVVVDQAAIGSIDERVAQVYRGYGDIGAGTGSFVVTLLLTVGVLGALGWLWTIRGAARGRRWVAPVGTALFVLGAGTAVLVLTAAEYGRTLVPTWLGLLGLLPILVGLVAVVQLWRAGRR